MVSVGNISAGGTGKTVLVAEIGRWLIEAGRRPAVLLRGYRGGGSPVGSDEAAMLRQLLAGATIEADPDRVAAGRRLLSRPNPPDVFILDDGFQHRRLGRELDLVALDATLDPAGPLFRLLPRGLLREPPGSLRRADWAIITRADHGGDGAVGRLIDLARRYNPSIRIATCRHAPTGVVSDGQTAPLAALDGVRYLAFCGIGNPGAFRATLDGLPGRCADFVAFDDHHAYSQGDLAGLTSRAAAAGATVLLTTAKDSVKLAEMQPPLPIWSLPVRLDWLTGGDELNAAVLTAAGASADRRSANP